MAEHAYDEFDLAASRPEAGVRSFGSPVRSDATPANWDDLERYPEYDFGPLRVRVPVEARLRMADPDSLYSDAAFFVFPDGKVRLSVLAAPRGGHLWPERAEEIATMQANLGADVRAYTGEWGEELRITDDGETNWVIGVDGPRWMLLGRSTSPIGADAELVETMRDMIRRSVVYRGSEPLPVRTPLPLREPGTFDADSEDDRAETPYSGVVTLILPKVEAADAAEDHADHSGPADDSGSVWTRPPSVTDIPAAADGARHELRSVPAEPEPLVARNADDEMERGREASTGTAAEPPRRRGGILAAAALVVIVGLAGLVFALRGSTPGPSEPALAAPQQVNERLTPKETYPDDAYPAAPNAAKVVPRAPLPKVAPPLASGPALGGATPAPGVSGVKPATPRVTTPVRSSPAQANAAARPLPNSSSAARTSGGGTSRPALAPAAVGPSGQPTSQQTGSDDPDSKPRTSRSRSGRQDDGGDDGGPLGTLSDDVLGVVPGLG